MVQQEYIDKFEKIISFYNIDKFKIYDIARAISFAESFGTHPISINDLSKCGVDYFKEITNAPKAKELPDTRIMRMMCDTLTIALFTIKDDLFSNSDILSLLSDNVCGVLSEVDSKKHNRGSNHYKTVEECKCVLNKLSESCVSGLDYTKFVDVINKYADKFNSIFSYKNIYKFNRDIKDTLLPLSIRADLDKRVNTDCFNFIQDSVFNSTVAKQGYDTSSYCKLLSEVLFISTCQNIVINLESIENTNNPLCCTVCIKIVRALDGAKLYTPVKGSRVNTIIYTNARTKVLKEYLNTIFVSNGVVINNDYSLGQFDAIYEISQIVIKKIIRKGHI